MCHSVHRGGLHPGRGIWQTPPPIAYYGIRSTSGRYASYWNAFLFSVCFQLNSKYNQFFEYEFTWMIHIWCVMFNVLTFNFKIVFVRLIPPKNKGSFIAATATRYNRRHFSFQLLVIEMMALATQRKQNRALLRESFIVCITRLPITGHATISNLTIKLGTASVICLHSPY